MDETVAIFVPSLNRPHKLERLVYNIRDNTPEKHRIYFVVNDDESVATLDNLGVQFWRDKGGTWIERNNFLYQQTDEPYIFLGSDDLHFHPNWLTEALEVMKTVDGVVSVNDMFNPNGTSALVSRKYIKEMSGCIDTPDVIAYPGYHHNYADTELFQTAKSRNRFAYAKDSTVEHLHWEAGKSDKDSTYEKSSTYTTKDAGLFNSRKHLWG